MKISTAVLAAGASIAAVGVAQLVQRGRQHKQRNDLALSLIQIEWLSRASSDEPFGEARAAIGRPAGQVALGVVAARVGDGPDGLHSHENCSLRKVS
ncbi:hypothetical protein ACIQGT_15595 [Streptomyces sp. NPDC093108]|uniref:hypothetical protein n=1 Tax=Streptomyces sp. NPDC093108 TaxID=3366030 RepID=UPI0037F99BF9